jgi:predicted dehydrogenase
MTNPVRIGVVGVGNFGRLHALTLAGLAEAQLVDIVDRDEVARDWVRRELPDTTQFWTDLERALDGSGAEAWVIATNTESHVPLAEQILCAGASVLIEKPLADSLAAARRLEPLVPAGSCRVMLGHILLFAPELRRLLREVRQRGPVTYFHSVRHRPGHLADRLRETPLRLLLVHDLYLAFALMNGEEPSRAWLRSGPGRARVGQRRMGLVDGLVPHATGDAA